TLGRFPAAAGRAHAEQRAWLRQQVGPSVEAMVKAYAHIPFDEADGTLSDEDVDALPIEAVFATLIRVANDIDERLDAAPRYSKKAFFPVAAIAPLFRRVLGRLGVGTMADLLVRLDGEATAAPLAEALPEPMAGSYSHSPASGEKQLAAGNF